MTNTMITLVPEGFAKIGRRFLQMEPSDSCLECRFRAVCADKLRPGRIYQVVEILGKKLDCPIHGSVVTVRVEPAPIEALIDSRSALRGSIITYRAPSCDEPCELIELCKPIGLRNGDKCRILEVLDKISCGKGNLRRALLELLTL